jgi:hypothetical protein
LLRRLRGIAWPLVKAYVFGSIGPIGRAYAVYGLKDESALPWFSRLKGIVNLSSMEWLKARRVEWRPSVGVITRPLPLR